MISRLHVSCVFILLASFSRPDSFGGLLHDPVVASADIKDAAVVLETLSSSCWPDRPPSSSLRFQSCCDGIDSTRLVAEGSSSEDVGEQG